MMISGDIKQTDKWLITLISMLYLTEIMLTLHSLAYIVRHNRTDFALPDLPLSST